MVSRRVRIAEGTPIVYGGQRLGFRMSTAEPIVHCISGHAYTDRPASFEWHGEHHVVAGIERTRRVLSRISGTVRTVFYVTTEAGQRFRLSYEATSDRWTVEPEQES